MMNMMKTLCSMMVLRKKTPITHMWRELYGEGGQRQKTFEGAMQLKLSASMHKKEDNSRRHDGMAQLKVHPCM